MHYLEIVGDFIHKYFLCYHGFKIETIINFFIITSFRDVFEFKWVDYVRYEVNSLRLTYLTHLNQFSLLQNIKKLKK